MTGSQIVLYVLVALFIILYVRRMLLQRSIKQYTPSELSERLKNDKGMVLLDVRTNAERASGQIKPSVHVPVHELMKRMDVLEKYKGKEIICYCRTGNRSISAAVRLRKFGFNVANLKGGIAEWNFQGFK